MNVVRLSVAMFLLLLAASSLRAADPAKEEGFTALFDGRSLEHWRGYHQEQTGKGWKVEEGVLTFDGSEGGDIITKKEYGEFDLRFEWKVAPGSNSGVMYLVRLNDPAPYFSGPEYQILDDSRHPDGKNPKTSAGSLYALYAPEGKELKPVGEWNESRIVLQDNRVEHWLNGKKVVEAELGSPEWKELIANSKFNAWEQFAQARRGHIALQDHGDPVWYRNIRIKSLD